jgi:hypothetical protein
LLWAADAPFLGPAARYFAKTSNNILRSYDADDSIIFAETATGT